MNDSSPDPTNNPATDPTPLVGPPVDPVPVAPVTLAAPVSASGGAPDGQDSPDARRRQNRIAVYGTVALAVVLAFGGGLAIGRATAPEAPADAIATVDPAATPGSVPTAVPSAGAALPSEGARLGLADAKVTVDYWADYQCPYCSKFAREVIPLLESRIADGTVALVHRDYAFIGEESVDASIAVRCATPEGKYWAMHDAVYAAQNGENQGAFARPRLAEIAGSVGLDATAFAACMDDQARLVEVLDDTAAGVRTGIESTPTADVNGNRFLGVPDTAALLKAIDEAAAGAPAKPLPTSKPTSDPWTGTTTDGRTAGQAAAPVTVELWMDYQSQDAKPIAETLEPELRTRIDAGSIRVVQRDLATLGEQSVVAAAMVRCVAQQGGPAWFVHDILAISAQGADAGIYTLANLLRLSSQLGLEVKALDACLVDPAVEAAVKAETAEGTAMGLTTGPSIVIRVGDREVGRFSEALDSKAVLAAIDAAK
ncbi:MAG: DsbA family protein [Chloroflexi bacterium]|nr:DsbA family protein [Chloroflexota bacterium]